MIRRLKGKQPPLCVLERDELFFEAVNGTLTAGAYLVTRQVLEDFGDQVGPDVLFELLRFRECLCVPQLLVHQQNELVSTHQLVLEFVEDLREVVDWTPVCGEGHANGILEQIKELIHPQVLAVLFLHLA